MPTREEELKRMQSAVDGMKQFFPDEKQQYPLDEQMQNEEKEQSWVTGALKSALNRLKSGELNPLQVPDVQNTQEPRLEGVKMKPVAESVNKREELMNQLFPKGR